MIELLGYFLFFFAGLSFGLFGSGGSIIIIPILLYIFKISIYEATTYSLLLVFLISFFGTIKHIKGHTIKIKKIIFFIIPTLFFTVLSRLFLFPVIPEYIEIFNASKQSILMLLFSIVIFLCSISLFKTFHIDFKDNFKIILILIGSVIGILTGLLGIGGGFIIAPVLILFANMDIKQAASTTLFIIMINTLLALILEITIFNFQFEWTFILTILISSLIGVRIGINLLHTIDINLTKKMFSITLLLLSLVIFFIELF